MLVRNSVRKQVEGEIHKIFLDVKVALTQDLHNNSRTYWFISPSINLYSKIDCENLLESEILNVIFCVGTFNFNDCFQKLHCVT